MNIGTNFNRYVSPGYTTNKSYAPVGAYNGNTDNIGNIFSLNDLTKNVSALYPKVKVKSTIDYGTLRYVEGLKTGAALMKESVKSLKNALNNDLSSVKDTGKLVAAQAGKVADAYNGFLNAAHKKDDTDNRGNKLRNSLSAVSMTNIRELSDVGITFDAGEMKIDEEKIKEAAEDGRLEKMLADDEKTGFLNRLSEIANDAERNTASYISRESMLMNLMNGYDGLNKSPASDLLGMFYDIAI